MRRFSEPTCKEGHPEVRQEHHRDLQDVQGIPGLGTSRDEGGHPSAEGSDAANLAEGAVWPSAFALKELTASEEAKIGALVKRAVSLGLISPPGPAQSGGAAPLAIITRPVGRYVV